MYKNKYIHVNNEDTQAHLWNNMKNKQLVLHSLQLKMFCHEKSRLRKRLSKTHKGNVNFLRISL